MITEPDSAILQEPWAQAKWGIKQLIYIFVLRLLAGAVLTRLIYPFVGQGTQVWVTLADRGLTIFLIIFLVGRAVGNWWFPLGLTMRNLPRHLFIGVLAGVGLLVFLNIGERVFFHLAVTGYQEHPLVSSAKGALSARQFLLPLLTGGLVTPVAEEMLYRGMVFPVLARAMGIFLGIVNAALIFTLFHFSTYWFAEILFTGLVLTVLYWRTGSLIPGITAHAAVNSWRLIAAWLL